MTKKQKSKYRNKITAFEFLRAHPDMTSREMAKAMGRGCSSISGQIKQMAGSGRIIPTGKKNGFLTWRINDMPFGCSSPIRMKFERLLQEYRSKVEGHTA